ncbi:MAG: PDZ domain-containing protein [Acidimicrobiia bacterium]
MRSFEVMVDQNPDEPVARRRPTPRWIFGLVGGLVLAVVLSVTAWNVTLPYFSFSPYAPIEVEDLITVEGTVVDPDSELYMLTVSIGTNPVNVYEYISAQLDPDIDLVPREFVRPSTVSYEEYRDRNENLMDESVTVAKVVALQYLGYDVTFKGEGMLVVDTLEGTPAADALQPEDVIIAIEGKEVLSQTDGSVIIQSYEPGDTISLTLLRGEETLDVEVTLVEHTQNPGAPMVGFIPDTVNLIYDFPIDVEIDASAAIGPSGGLVYTLGVINALTPEVDELQGLIVAGTGTINTEGQVGAIGGVRQKVLGAERAGANVIFVPVDNYEEALSAGAPIEIVPVEHFEDALTWAASNPAA